MRKLAKLGALLICLLASRAYGAEWSGWTTVQGSNEDLSGGVDASWRTGVGTFMEKGMIFYRVRNRFNERVAITIVVTCQGIDGGQVPDTYTATLTPGQVDEAEGNWVTATQVLSYKVTSFSFPDRAAQQQQQQELTQQRQQQQQAEALRQQQLQQQQDRLRQQYVQRRQEQQQAQREWQKEHDAKVRAAQERIESITNATAARENAINGAANQIIAVIQQQEEERQARRDLEQIQEEQEEHETEQRQTEDELAKQQRELDAFHQSSVAMTPSDSRSPILTSAIRESLEQAAERERQRARVQREAEQLAEEAQKLASGSSPQRTTVGQTGQNTSALDQLVNNLGQAEQPNGSNPLDQLVDSIPAKPTEPAPRPVADCKGLSVDDAFLRDAQASGDKCTCWVSGAYTVKGAVGVEKQIYVDASVQATIADDNGNYARSGGNLKIANLSSRHNVYYGLSGAINGKLAPGQSRLVGLSIYQTNGREQEVMVDVSLRYCKE